MKRKRFECDVPAERKGVNRELIVILKNRYSLLRLKKNICRRDRPNISSVLWWDWDYEVMDFHGAHVAVIARVIEKGTKKEWKELVKFYGLLLVIHDLKKEIWFLTAHAIEEVCAYFCLSQDEMKCYHFRKTRQLYWF